MSSLNTSPAQRSLRREWLIARIVVIGGFAIALLAALYFGVLVPWVLQPRAQRAELISRIETLLHAEAQICTMALASAKNFGIVPQYGQLATPKLAPTDVQGRYICLAATKVTKYVLAVDLLCRDLKNARCTSLYNVTQADGTILYQRQR